MKNLTIKAAVEAVNKGNVKVMKEIAAENPLVLVAIARNDLAALVQCLDADTEEAADKAEPKTQKQEKAAKQAKAEKAAPAEENGEDLSSMSTKQLMQLCDKRGIKVPHYGKNKQFYLDALQNAANETEQETEAEEAAETTEVEEDAYTGKSAQELYKMAKKRGLKVEQKKPAKYYIAALKKADEEAKAAEAEAEEENWDDDEEEVEETKPAKNNKSKGTAKSAPEKSKASKPAKEEVEEDDDDWDI